MEKDEMIRSLIMTKTELMEILKCQKKIYQKIQNEIQKLQKEITNPQLCLQNDTNNIIFLPHKPPTTGW